MRTRALPSGGRRRKDAPSLSVTRGRWCTAATGTCLPGRVPVLSQVCAIAPHCTLHALKPYNVTGNAVSTGSKTTASRACSRRQPFVQRVELQVAGFCHQPILKCCVVAPVLTRKPAYGQRRSTQHSIEYGSSAEQHARSTGMSFAKKVHSVIHGLSFLGALRRAQKCASFYVDEDNWLSSPCRMLGKNPAQRLASTSDHHDPASWGEVRGVECAHGLSRITVKTEL
jgi:hypothetical protein